MSQEPVSAATERILELWNDGIPVVAILAILIQEGFTTELGDQYDVETIAQVIDRHERRLLENLDQSPALQTCLTSDERLSQDDQSEPYGQIPSPPNMANATEDHCRSDVFVTKHHLSTALAHAYETFREELRLACDAIRREFTELSAPVLSSQRPRDCLPPDRLVAPLQDSREPTLRVKVDATVDAELMVLIEHQCKELNISLSSMLDTMAWHYFGKPKLAFQCSEEDSAPTAPIAHDPS